MPPVRAQSFVYNPATLTGTITLDTVITGRLVITAVRSGSNVTLQATKDGVLISGAGITNPQTFTNPTAAQIETWCQNTLGAVLNIKKGTLTIETMQFRVHVFALNPLNVNILTANTGVTIPPNWYALS